MPQQCSFPRAAGCQVLSYSHSRETQVECSVRDAVQSALQMKLPARRACVCDTPHTSLWHEVTPHHCLRSQVKHLSYGKLLQDHCRDRSCSRAQCYLWRATPSWQHQTLITCLPRTRTNYSTQLTRSVSQCLLYRSTRSFSASGSLSHCFLLLDSLQLVLLLLLLLLRSLWLMKGCVSHARRCCSGDSGCYCGQLGDHQRGHAGWAHHMCTPPAHGTLLRGLVAVQQVDRRAKGKSWHSTVSSRSARGTGVAAAREHDSSTWGLPVARQL